jgi:hypothetical protein
MAETNPLQLTSQQWNDYLDSVADESVCWTDARLKRIDRLRLLSDRDVPFWDLSYCYGQLHDGTNVAVLLPFYQISKKKGIKATIIEYAKRDGVYAKGLGVFDAISTLI